VADVGVFRSFPSMQFGPSPLARLTSAVEDTLITNRCAFQLVFDSQTDELSRWPVLVLPGCVALSDIQVKRIRRYVASGGHLCVIGPVATHDEWMRPRQKPALDDLPPSRVVLVAETDDWLEAIRRACGSQLSLLITCNPPGDAKRADDPLASLCAELTEQPTRRLVHLVNYRSDAPLENFAVRVSLPKRSMVKSVTLASPERAADMSLPFQRHSGEVTFTVPTVGVYEIAIVEFVRSRY
jgi:hypothetical protein